MIPNYRTLIAAKGKFLTGAMLTQVSADNSPSDTRIKGFNVELTRDDDGNLVIQEAEPGAPDQGIYISYVVGKIAYFKMMNGGTWLCSGPFSGCKFEIGKAADGLIYGAHIHMDAKNHMDTVWDHARDGALGNSSEKYRRRISGITESEAAAVVRAGKNPANVNAFAFVCLNGGNLKKAEWCKIMAGSVGGRWKILRVDKA